MTPKYSIEELYLLFEYYQQYIEKINEYTTFPPTKKNFCGFCGISSNIYDLWRESDDLERADIMEKIDDYITNQMLILAQLGKIKEVTTIFRSKAENKMIEAQAPIVVEHKTELDLDEIQKQVQAMKSGKPIIEIEKIEGENQ